MFCANKHTFPGVLSLVMGIVFIVDGICTLVDVVIVNPTRAYLVLQIVFSRGVVVTIIT